MPETPVSLKCYSESMLMAGCASSRPLNSPWWIQYEFAIEWKILCSERIYRKNITVLCHAWMALEVLHLKLCFIEKAQQYLCHFSIFREDRGKVLFWESSVTFFVFNLILQFRQLYNT